VDATVVVAGLLGLLVGSLSVLAAGYSERTQRGPAPSGDSDDLPAGVPDLLAVLGGPAVVLDVADEVVRASPAAYAAGLVVGSALAPPVLVEAVRGARRDGEVRELELELPSGGLGRGGRVLGVRVAPLGTLHVVVLATDRTEARRLDEVRRDFVVNVSHELKTPVGALSLLAEATEDAAEDPVAVRRFAGRMQVESRRLALLVHDVVELSRLQDGVPPSAPARVLLDAVVEEAVDRCRATAETRGITVDVGPRTGLEVFGDAELLTTAVRNLVDNALRYSEQGTRVGVGVRLHEDWAEVAVADQGIGIGPDQRERVFERFYRIDPARSRATGGTGLGLSIVKHVAVGHGGDVQLWSQVGQGSTFTLRLPPAPPEPPAAPSAAPLAAPTAGDEEEMTA
jgi:two-component system, OmpR family, sensor histidine kinase SenX3